MSRIPLLGAGVFVLAVVTSIIALWVFFGTKPPPKPATQTPTQSVKKSKENQGAANIEIPISRKNPFVKFLQFKYTFTGKITDIQDTSQGTVVFTNIKAKVIPAVLVKESTPINFFSKGKLTPAKKEDLKSGQNIRLASLYSPEKKEWSTISITILTQSTTSTPSANTTQ